MLFLGNNQHAAFAVSDQTWSTNTTLPAGNLFYGKCVITNNAIVLVTSATTSIFCSSMTINAGATLTAYGQGNPGGVGTGTGSCVDNSGDGAGYGGKGGARTYDPLNSWPGPAWGNPDIATETKNPNELGSGGGCGGPGGGTTGGAGGGYINLIIGNTLTVNGIIAASGVTGTEWRSGTGLWYGGGGGSGGSIKITANKVAGTGAIRANGGSGGGRELARRGGGGGGGRVAIIYSTSNSITPSVAGGTGSNSGLAGTTYIYNDLSVYNYSGAGESVFCRGAITGKVSQQASSGNPNAAGRDLSAGMWKGGTSFDGEVDPVNTMIAYDGVTPTPGYAPLYRGFAACVDAVLPPIGGGGGPTPDLYPIKGYSWNENGGFISYSCGSDGKKV